MSEGIFFLLIASIGGLISLVANWSFRKSNDPFFQPIIFIIGAMMGVGGGVCLLLDGLAAMIGP